MILEVLRAYSTLFFRQEKGFHDHILGRRAQMMKYSEFWDMI
jgi:hypothetical protein